jgi:hypothetical protein
MTDAVPHAESQDTTPWGPAIGAYLSTLEPKDQLEGPAKFIAILEPDLIEGNMARSVRIDEAIDRTIKRLVQVKTAKQIFPNMRRNAKGDPKLINVPALTGPGGCRRMKTSKMLNYSIKLKFLRNRTRVGRQNL